MAGTNDEKRYRWVEFTGPELAALIAADPVLILPLGSVEQHGPHLPVGVDAACAEAVALRTVEAFAGEPRVLVLPTLWYGYTPNQMSFAGTISIDSQTLIRLLCEIVGSVLAHGVRRLVILNGHGRNIGALDVAVARIGEGLRQPAHVVGTSYWNLVAHRTEEFRESPPGGIAHGGEFETSLQIALNPHLVHRHRAEKHIPQFPSQHLQMDLFAGSALHSYYPFESFTTTGTIGDPTLASEEKGARILSICCEELGRFLKEFATWPIP